MLPRATRWALPRCDAIIVVNTEIRSPILDHVDPDRIEVLPAFPEAPPDESLYDASVEDFLTSGRTLLLCAFRVTFLPDGRDLSGLDIGVDAFAALAAERPELRLALFIAELPSARKAMRYLRALAQRLEEAGLRDRVLVVFGLPLTAAFRHEVIVVRSTRSEGDALSVGVREALHARVLVVASDVVGRPAGASTFASDNTADLRRALVEILDGTKETAKRPVGTPDDAASGAELVASLLQIYRRQIASASMTPPADSTSEAAGLSMDAAAIPETNNRSFRLSTPPGRARRHRTAAVAIIRRLDTVQSRACGKVCVRRSDVAAYLEALTFPEGSGSGLISLGVGQARILSARQRGQTSRMQLRKVLRNTAESASAYV